MADVFIEESTMTAIADSIRAKTGKEDKILPADMPAEIDGIESGGEEIFFTPYGVGYTKNMQLDITSLSSSSSQYAHATNMKTAYFPNLQPSTTSGVGGMFDNCTSLTEAYLPKITKYSHYTFKLCTSLKTCQLGSIGYPVTRMTIYTFVSCKQDDLVITIFVDAETLADIPADVATSAPWGATNATIIYRNSTTGEVIEA